MAFKAFGEERKFSCTEGFKRTDLSNAYYDTYLEGKTHQIFQVNKFRGSLFPVDAQQFSYMTILLQKMTTDLQLRALKSQE